MPSCAGSARNFPARSMAPLEDNDAPVDLLGLAELLAGRGDLDRLRARANVGDSDAAGWLIRLADRGDPDGAEQLLLPAADLDLSGRARLSYQQAAALFSEASGGATLHQLRHSALTHDAEDGTGTPMLMARSGHTSVRSLAKYAKVSAEALARTPGRPRPGAAPVRR